LGLFHLRLPPEGSFSSRKVGHSFQETFFLKIVCLAFLDLRIGHIDDLDQTHEQHHPRILHQYLHNHVPKMELQTFDSGQEL